MILVQVVCEDFRCIESVFRIKRDVATRFRMQDSWEDLNGSRVVAAKLPDLSRNCAVSQKTTEIELKIGVAWILRVLAGD